jgi:hypothetical protein
MSKIPILEKFAAQSLVEHDGELIFSKEKFAELVIKETLQVARAGIEYGDGMEDAVYKYFGVEE